MGRPLRVEVKGVWYHITGRGNERKAIFRDEEDQKKFVELVQELEERFGLRIGAYVLMGNHYHLLVELLEANLSRGIQWLQVNYAIYFNRRHKRVGHLFQARYSAVAIEDGPGVAEVSRYIHLNPVRVAALGLSKSQQFRLKQGQGDRPAAEMIRAWKTRLASHRWSSYPAYSRLNPGWIACGEVMRRLGLSWDEEGRRRYAEYVVEGLLHGGEEGFPRDVHAGTFYGSEIFLAKMKLLMKGDAKEQKTVRRMAVRPEWNSAVRAVERVTRQNWDEFQAAYGNNGREMVMKLAREKCGMTLREIGEKTELNYNATSMAIHRFSLRLKKDAPLRERYEKVVAAIDEM